MGIDASEGFRCGNLTMPNETLPYILLQREWMKNILTTKMRYAAHALILFMLSLLMHSSFASNDVMGFNRSTIVTTTAHEVFPGHCSQFLWQRLNPSRVRRLIDADSNSEGWAHYAEQLIVDAGYHNYNPPNLRFFALSYDAAKYGLRATSYLAVLLWLDCGWNK